MNLEEYKKWLERITMLMKVDGESDEFIEYLVDWMNSIKSKNEIDLVQNYHPSFKNKSRDEIIEFIINARIIIKDAEESEYKRQIFDSAFFLYRPLLKKMFIEEECKSQQFVN